MKLYGAITQLDKDRKTAKIRYDGYERIMVDYSGRGEEYPDETSKVFEPILLDSMITGVKVTVRIDEEWRVFMVEKLI